MMAAWDLPGNDARVYRGQILREEHVAKGILTRSRREGEVHPNFRNAITSHRIYRVDARFRVRHDLGSELSKREHP